MHFSCDTLNLFISETNTCASTYLQLLIENVQADFYMMKLCNPEPDQEIILTLLGSWRFDEFLTSKRGKICTNYAEFFMWETGIDFWSIYRENSTILEVV